MNQSFPAPLHYPPYAPPPDYSTLKIPFTVIFHFSKNLQWLWLPSHESQILSLVFRVVLPSGPMTFPHLCSIFICSLFHKNPKLFLPWTFHLCFSTHSEHTSFQWSFRIPIFNLCEINNTRVEREGNVNTVRHSACHSTWWEQVPG